MGCFSSKTNKATSSQPGKYSPPVNPHTEEKACVEWEICTARYFEVLGLKRSPFEASSIEKIYRDKYAQSSKANDTEYMIRLNKAK